MKQSILDGKRILAVDDEPDVLKVLEEEIREASPNTTLDQATTYDDALKKMESRSYDLVILDIMGVRGFDLLEQAVRRDLRVVMLTAHALHPEALKRAFDMKARAYLPKDKLGEIVPFLEDALSYEFLPGWKSLFYKLAGFFDEKFSYIENKSGLAFWYEMKEKLGSRIRDD